MATITLAVNVPDRASIGTTVQRYEKAANAHHGTWVRIYSSAECYLVLGDVADGDPLPTDYETIPAGTVASRLIRRGEFGVAGSGSQTVEVTLATREGAA